MTIKEKLLQELACAIDDTFGAEAEKEYLEENDDLINEWDIDAIAKKVKFYLDL